MQHTFCRTHRQKLISITSRDVNRIVDAIENANPYTHIRQASALKSLSVTCANVAYEMD